MLAYIFVLVLARLMGSKLISEMTFFNFVTGISLGTLMADLITSSRFTSTDAAVAMLVLTILTIGSGYLTLKNRKLHKWLNAEPISLISDGRIIAENLKQARISLSQLQMLLREKDAFNIADVEFAMMEPDGELSVLLKSQKQPVTPSELNIATPYQGLTVDLIIDGQILEANLERVRLSKAWLLEQLNSKGIQGSDAVFYAGLDTLGALYISERNK